jgi:cytochrome oxidase Cu insertion factor (SCO1/SenC/PrrC family)
VQANERLDDDEDYLVDHSIVLYLVDKNGEFVDFFTQRAQIGDVVDKIEAHMKTYEAAALAAK